ESGWSLCWNGGCNPGGMAEKPYDLLDPSVFFACEIVAFARIVSDRGYVFRRLPGQLVTFGVGVGANLEEGVEAQTKPDFIAKQFIALKEARETRFWLRVIAVSEPALEPRAKPLIAEASEFVAMLTTSVKTARSSLVPFPFL